MKTVYLLLIFYINYSDAVRYIGCYKEISVTARLLSGNFTNFRRTLTPDLCIQNCKKNAMNYAGLQHGHECFCDVKRPSFTYLADPENCDAKCVGDQSKICGGVLRLSIYDITGRAGYDQLQNYLGCFANSYDYSLLSSKLFSFPKLLTPEYCLGHCWREGYRYAGVQNGTQCHCDDEISMNDRVNEFECSIPCSGYRQIRCGGDLRTAVYKTGITDESALGKLLGCFNDEGVRMLSGIELWLHSTNSPKKCLNICLSLGYQYAGVEYKVQCFCGDVKPSEKRRVAENQCHISCPVEGTHHCGGSWRVLIYETGLNLVERKKPSLTTTPVTTTIRTTTTPRPTPRTTTRTTTRPTSTRRTTTVRRTTPSTTTYQALTNLSTENFEDLACSISLTSVKGEIACSGQLIFSEQFNAPINRQFWRHSIFMPASPDYEFVTYSDSDDVSYIRNGKLVIKPKMYDEDFIRRGKVKLQRCTGELFSTECERQAVGFAILPPIESARLTTKESFSFRYGRVEIRARLPKGDWVYPELWLEPKRLVYGPEYTSGRLRIAMARGNPSLVEGSKELGNTLLESGVLVGLGGTVRARSVKRSAKRPWTSDFHNYSMIWTPDDVKFLVDGKMVEGLIPGEKNKKLVDYMGFNNTQPWFFSNVRMAPFDQEFYLTVGLSVGGIRNFPDGTYSNGKIKPWRNIGTKAMATFFQDYDNWIETWSYDRTLIEVDSIQVYAL